MKINILFGGKAGQGSNFLGNLFGEILTKQSYFVFYYRDYQSLIRGGHNFNILSFSDKPIYSNDSTIDILVALDENTLKIHKKNLKKGGHILSGDKANGFFAGALSKLLGLDFGVLEKELKSFSNFEENLKLAKEGYESEKSKNNLEKLNQNNEFSFYNGAEGVAKGAVKAGLDVYYAYPMTPATSLLGILAKKQVDKNYLVLELENEIGVINAAVGSAMTGAKSMVGTSGGGFDLMSETLSMCGMAEIPLVIYLAQRPGPGTGVPTYSTQTDLNVAIHGGHGEFPRMVLAPGDPVEAASLTSEAFYFSQKYKIPTIVLSDKHLAESTYSLIDLPKIKKALKSTVLKKYTSYEHTSKGVSTEDPLETIKGHDYRLKKMKDISKESENFEMFKIYGNKKSKNLIIGWGSTKGVILDAIQGLDCQFLQILYLNPFSMKIKDYLDKADKILVVETNSTSQISGLIAENTGILIKDKNKILKYDARPFYTDELKKLIEQRLK